MSKFISKLLFLCSFIIYIGTTYNSESPESAKPPKKIYTARYLARKADEKLAENERLIAPIKAKLAIAQVTHMRRMLLRPPGPYRELYIIADGPDGLCVILPRPQELHEYRTLAEHKTIINVYRQLDKFIAVDYETKLPCLNKADYDAYRDRLYRERDKLFANSTIYDFSSDSDSGLSD